MRERERERKRDRERVGDSAESEEESESTKLKRSEKRHRIKMPKLEGPCCPLLSKEHDSDFRIHSFTHAASS